MRGFARSLLMVGAIMVAGCTTPSVDDAALDAGVVDPETLDNPVLTNTFTGCMETLGVIPFPMEFTQDMMLPGFRPEPFDPLGQSGILLLLAYTCPEATVGNETLEDAGLIFAGVVVIPPDEFAADRYAHVLPLGAITTHDALTDAYTAWGIPYAETGSVTVELMANTPAARQGHALASGSFDIHLYTTTSGPIATIPGGLARAYGNDGEKVTHLIEWAFTDSPGSESGTATAPDLIIGGVAIPPLYGGIGMQYLDIGYALEAIPVGTDIAAADEPATG